MVAQVKPDQYKAAAVKRLPAASQYGLIDPHELSIADAKLPVVYESAKVALSECSKIDECKDWANKAEALASYARQADDDSLRNMAVRIQARAIRRCGELLKQIEDDNRGRKPKVEICTGTDTNFDSNGKPPKQSVINGAAAVPVSRTQAARDAGMSKRQKDTALRVASVPTEEFEAAVESDTPPTVTKLAEIGTRPQPKPLVDLKGRAPEEFEACTRARGATERFDEFAAQTSPAAVARGASEQTKVLLRERADRIIKWLQQLQKELA
jgi:hypothetical protein